jgi:hypothetical protein
VDELASLVLESVSSKHGRFLRDFRGTEHQLRKSHIISHSLVIRYSDPTCSTSIFNSNAAWGRDSRQWKWSWAVS